MVVHVSRRRRLGHCVESAEEAEVGQAVKRGGGGLSRTWDLIGMAGVRRVEMKLGTRAGAAPLLVLVAVEVVHRERRGEEGELYA